MANELTHIIQNLEACFDGKPWYGIAMMEKLDSIPWGIVNEQEYGSKSIAVLVQHIINWRIFLLKKLDGDETYDLKIDSVEDWTAIHIASEKQWVELKMKLRETQDELLKKLAVATEELLVNQVPGKPYTFLPILTSITQHDLYHLGQIAMLDAMQRS